MSRKSTSKKKEISNQISKEILDEFGQKCNSIILKGIILAKNIFIIFNKAEQFFNRIKEHYKTS